jgi:hypothetical protein
MCGALSSEFKVLGRRLNMYQRLFPKKIYATSGKK